MSACKDDDDDEFRSRVSLPLFFLFLVGLCVGKSGGELLCVSIAPRRGMCFLYFSGYFARFER